MVESKILSPKICVIIPAYKVSSSIAEVVSDIPTMVKKIFVIDDACPESSGKKILSQFNSKRVEVIFHSANKGVGGAMKTGYKQAAAQGYDIAIKIDGDGQMNSRDIQKLIDPIILGTANYTKGNRFYNLEDLTQMPLVRLIGNSILSFITKFSSGYWNIVDPTNGFTAINLKILPLIPLHKLDDRYFFESDMLFRLNCARAVVKDIPIQSRYGDEKSNLVIKKIVFKFLTGHTRNFLKRIFYSYYLRDMNIASFMLPVGIFMLTSGAILGVRSIARSWFSGVIASSGTVVLSSMLILLGIQFLISFLNYDVSNFPKDPNV